MSSSEADAKDVNNSSSLVATKPNLLKGMKIRDEFICPITYELMREPFIATDGHTYEKSAIEKWLKNNNTSPRSGEPLESTIIIPNINLKKLIQDIINEGGAAFYTNDISNKDRLVEVCPEKVLILECLGPPECDWNQQSFQVNRCGCVGGRRHNVEDSNNSKEIILFKDITVSRRHFEITQAVEPNGKNMNFYIRDLGSAGGTFIRIMFGTRKELHPGMIILLGKHQFTVSSIDDSGGADDEDSPNRKSRGTLTRRSLYAGNGANQGLRRSGLNSEILKSLVKNAEMIIEDISKDATGEDRQQKDELSARLKSLTVELSCHLGMEAVAEQFGEHGELLQDDRDVKQVMESKQAFQVPGGLGATSNNLDISSDAKDIRLSPHSPCKPVSDHKILSIVAEDKEEPLGGKLREKKYGSEEEDAKNVGIASLLVNHKTDFSTKRCTLTCCAPDGSPLQGKSFIVGPEGASMGRKQTNNIPLLTKIADPTTGEERIANVDTAISSEHARVEFDADHGRFYICDGTISKASTNGTWFRLSGPHQESPPHLLHSGTEVLIGTIRFQVKESMTISERKVTEEK